MRATLGSGRHRLAELIRRLEAEGRPYALATVVRRRPPVSAQTGDQAVVTAEGRVVGWIGGSCSEPLVRQEALAAIADGRPRLLRLAVAEEAGAPLPDEAGVRTVAMRCPSGGEMEVYIEPRAPGARLVAVGESPLVRALALLAPVVGLEALVVAEDPDRLDLPADAAEVVPLGGFLERPLAPDAYVVVASAGRYDEVALKHALAAPAPYVALVASRRRAAAVLEVLAREGVPEEARARVRTPAGLDIGAKTQEEIALAVLAEVVARRRSAAAPPPSPAPAVAVDPVCGMTVALEEAGPSAEYGGRTYRFCCAHCRMAFLADPQAYVGAETGDTPP